MVYWSFGRIIIVYITKTTIFVVKYSNLYLAMNSNIFSLDISCFSQIDMATSIEGEIALQDNIDDCPSPDKIWQPQNCFPIQAQMPMILLCIEGETHIRVALKEYVLRPHDFCIIMTGVIFEILSISEDFKGLVVATRSNFMPVTENTMQVMSFYKSLRNVHCFSLGEKELEEFLKVYRAIRVILKEVDHPFKISILQSYVQILYYWIAPMVIKESELQAKSPRTRQEEIFEHFITEVEAHYRQERSVKFYADLLCLTPKYLSSVIYNVSQRLAGEWIDVYVILEAKTLLKSGKLTIQQISEHLNFSNQSFFGKFFKRYTGLSPKEYKNS